MRTTLAGAEHALCSLLSIAIFSTSFTLSRNFVLAQNDSIWQITVETPPEFRRTYAKIAAYDTVLRKWVVDSVLVLQKKVAKKIKEEFLQPAEKLGEQMSKDLLAEKAKMSSRYKWSKNEILRLADVPLIILTTVIQVGKLIQTLR